MSQLQPQLLVKALDSLGIDPRLTLLEALRDIGYSGQAAVIAQGPDDAARMRAAGADLMLDPYPDAAVRAAERITADRSAAALP